MAFTPISDEYADRLTVIAQAERIGNLCHLLRQHRCNADEAMTVGECVDSGRCGCSCGLYMEKQS